MRSGSTDYNVSFINLHKMCERATPEMYMNYKLALCLFKLYNIEYNPIEFVQLNFNQILTGRQLNFTLIKSNTFKVGINSLSNRLASINNKIPLSWLNLLLDSFKIRCKDTFIKFWTNQNWQWLARWDSIHYLCTNYSFTPPMQYVCKSSYF